MWQLASHILLIVILYRGYKYYFSDWTSWYIFLYVWHITFLLINSLIATTYWFIELWHINYILIYMNIISNIIFIIYCSTFMLVAAKLNGWNSEYWWSSNYTYYRYIILLNFQQWIYTTNINQNNYYNQWYRLQSYKNIINIKWICIAITIYGFSLKILFSVVFKIIFFDHYFAYWICFMWEIYDSLYIEVLIVLNIYIGIKYISWICVLFYTIINTFNQEVGVVIKNMYLYENIINIKWICIAITIYGFSLKILFSVVFKIIFFDHYFAYWICFMWEIYDSLYIEVLIVLNIYIGIKYISWICVLFYTIINTFNQEVGVVIKNMYLYENTFTNYKIDYQLTFCYEKVYHKIIAGNELYETPISWSIWKQEVSDMYVLKIWNNLSLINKFCKFNIYSKIWIWYDRVKYISLFSFDYNYIFLEQELEYKTK